MILVGGRPFREWVGDEIPKAVPHSYPSKSLKIGNGPLCDFKGLLDGSAVFETAGDQRRDVCVGYGVVGLITATTLNP